MKYFQLVFDYDNNPTSLNVSENRDLMTDGIYGKDRDCAGLMEASIKELQCGQMRVASSLLSSPSSLVSTSHVCLFPTAFSVRPILYFKFKEYRVLSLVIQVRKINERIWSCFTRPFRGPSLQPRCLGSLTAQVLYLFQLGIRSVLFILLPEVSGGVLGKQQH